MDELNSEKIFRSYQIERSIICVDIKSFYASVECSLRGLDPFKTPLVVCDKGRGKSALCLAVTPYLKSLGVGSRARLEDIPEDIRSTLIYAKPRMKKYLEYTMKIIEIYLSFVGEDDLYVYSVDEAFLDLTPYLSLYKTTPLNLAKKISAKIKQDLNLFSSAGVGPNMLLAKFAMDLEAKKLPSGVAEWKYEDVETKLWPITPLSKIWGIGSRMERNLNLLGLFKIGDIANSDLNILKEKFGVIGEELYYHTHGIDMSLIRDKHLLRTHDKSLGNSQILFYDYYPPEIYTLILEMADEITRRLRLAKKIAWVVHFGVGYNHQSGGGLHQQVTLDQPTASFKVIYELCLDIFDRLYENKGIRSIFVSVSGLQDENFKQLSIFEDVEHFLDKENRVLKALDEIKRRYGKNAANRASSELSHSTIKQRNKFIGGHHE